MGGGIPRRHAGALQPLAEPGVQWLAKRTVLGESLDLLEGAASDEDGGVTIPSLAPLAWFVGCLSTDPSLAGGPPP